jgi:hypothetical protein
MQNQTLPDYGVTDPTSQRILCQSSFRLTERQAEGLVKYVGFVASQTAEVIAHKCKDLKLRRIEVRDFGAVGATDEARCQAGHPLRFLWIIRVGDDTSPEECRFGVTCAEHVLGLSSAERTLVRALDRWTNRNAKRELLHELGKMVAQGLTGEQIWKQYETGDKHAEVKAALDVLKDNEEMAVTALPLVSQDEKTQRRRLQQIGRVCAAVKTAQFLLGHSLLVPPTMHRWLANAARRVKRASAARASAMAVPLAPPIAPAMIGSFSMGEISTPTSVCVSAMTQLDAQMDLSLI